MKRMPCIVVFAGVFLPLVFAIRYPVATADDSDHRPSFDLEYPETRRGEAFDEYHGVKVADPYRWLEEMESSKTRTWVKSQDELFRAFVKEMPRRNELLKRIEAIGRFDSHGLPVRAGASLFFTKTAAGQKRAILYRQNGRDGSPAVCLDSTRSKAFGEDDQLNGWKPSPAGHLLAFGVAPGQSGWRRLRILDVNTGVLRADRLEGLGDFNSVHWIGGKKQAPEGFFYRRFDVPEDLTSASFALDNPRICHHRLGADQSEDVEIIAFPDRPDWFVGAGTLTPDDRFLVVGVREKKSRVQRIFYRDLLASSPRSIQLIEDTDRFTFLTNRGTKLLFYTESEAPLGRVIAIDIDRPAKEHWAEWIPERKNRRLNNVSVIGDRLAARYVVDASPVLELFDLDGHHVHTVELPGIGGVGIAGTPGQPEAFYSFGNLFNPGTIHRLDLATGKSQVFRRLELNFDPNDYQLKQVFYKSHDGTRVPMFIAHRRDLRLSGETPLWMYGFGHSGWSAFPWFQAHLVAWMDLGGVYALPGIRGGGEYGAAWTEAGMRRNKPTAIADYIAAGEWLIENGYTSRRGLVANGGSASGMVPVVAAIRRPDVFAAAVSDVPFLDMIRYPLFAQGFTSGFGSPEDPDDFRVLFSYSPYHNLKAGTCYPPILISVAERDQATAPLHAYKFMAALQAAQACDRPALMQVIWGAGHYTFGTSPEQRHETLANQIAFLVRALGIRDRESSND